MDRLIDGRRPSLMLLALLLVGCGYSEDEWQAQLAKYEDLARQHQALQAELDAEHARGEQLNSDLQQTGVELQQVTQQAESLKKAIAEYKARAELLDRLRERFERLREKLQKLTELGLEVTIRHNKMVVSLPGDVLFASGSDELSRRGEEVLVDVAKVFREDSQLVERYFQVAGHTDSQPLVRTLEQFKDNWGLSLMRARQVLLFLTQPVADGGGGLDENRWSAAGYGSTDPIASNQTRGSRKKNRRVELVLQPNVEEMLDLKSLLNPEASSDAGPS